MGVNVLTILTKSLYYLIISIQLQRLYTHTRDRKIINGEKVKI